MCGQLTHQLLLGGSRIYPQRVSPTPGYLEEGLPSCAVTQLSAKKKEKEKKRNMFMVRRAKEEETSLKKSKKKLLTITNVLSDQTVSTKNPQAKVFCACTPIQQEENEIPGSAAYPNRHSQQISQDPLPQLQPLRYMA